MGALVGTWDSVVDVVFGGFVVVGLGVVVVEVVVIGITMVVVCGLTC